MTFLSEQKFLADHAVPGSPYFTNSRLRDPHKEHCFIAQDADDRPFLYSCSSTSTLLLNNSYLPTQPNGLSLKTGRKNRKGRNLLLINVPQCPCLYASSTQPTRSIAAEWAVIVFPTLGPGPLIIHPSGPYFTESCI